MIDKYQVVAVRSKSAGGRIIGTDVNREPHLYESLYPEGYVSTLLGQLEDERAAREQWQKNCRRVEQLAEAAEERAAGAECKVLKIAKLLTDIKNSRPGGVYFNKWDEKINEMMKDADISELLAELEAKDKRIAELERANTSQDDHINQQQDRIDSLEKTNTGLGRRLGDAEKRLATPVRLPDTRFIKVGDTAVAVMHAASVKEQIQRAGFKVEGDAQ